LKVNAVSIYANLCMHNELYLNFGSATVNSAKWNYSSIPVASTVCTVFLQILWTSEHTHSLRLCINNPSWRFTSETLSGWTHGVEVKLWNPLSTRAIPKCLRGAFTTRCYTNPCLPYLTLRTDWLNI